MKRILSAIVVASVLVSCGTNSEKTEPVTTATTPQPFVVPTGNTSPVTSPVTGTVPVTNPATQANPVSITSTPAPTPGTPAAGLNPAHGQPGHRCDIAVGAPLNSTKVTPTAVTSNSNNTTTTMSQPVITTSGSNAPVMNFTPPAPTKTATAPGMNPAHGQPGHRCDITVGAPLNSKPTVAAATPPTSPTIQTISTPPVIRTTPVKDSSK